MRHRMRAGLIAVLATVAAVALAPTLEATSSASPPLSPPNPPTAISLSSGNRSIAVSWSETSTGSITYVATAQATGRPTRSCTTKQLGCTIVSLNNGVVYVVTVVARNKSGSSSASVAASVRAGVPGPPRIYHLMPSPSTLTVSWTPPLASGVARITSYMATTSPGGFSCSTTGTILSRPGRTCVIAGLTPGTTYAVTVSATNAYGTGLPSAPVSAGDE